MKRKYLSALLMGTLTVASMSTFTSCKDYDDDISNLQGQIDKLATADQLAQKVSELQALISANKSDITSLQSELAKKTTLDEVKAVLANYAEKQYVEDALATLDAAVKAQGGDITALQDAVKAAQAAADKAAEDAKAANAEILETLKTLATKTEVAEVEKAAKAANDAIEALKAGDIKTLQDKQADILKTLETVATQSDLKTVADNAAAALKAAQDAQAKKNEAAEKALKDAETKLAASIKTAQSTADAAKKQAAENLASINGLATTVKNAKDALALAQANQTKLNEALASLNDSSKEGTVAAAIKTIQAQIGTPDNKLGSLDTRLAAIESVLNGVKDDDTKLGLATKVTNIENKLKDIIGQYSTMVTDVQLYNIDGNHGNVWVNGETYTQTGSNYGSFWGNGSASPSVPNGWDTTLQFTQAVEKGNKFPADAKATDKQLSFEEGKYYVGEDSLLIRVSPVDAELTTSNVSLLSSQGKELTGLVDVTDVHRFSGLLTRSAGTNTGLWVVKFKANDLGDQFKKAAWVKDEYDNDRSILYAVAVKNTYNNTSDKDEDNKTRRVTSEFGVELNTQDARPAWDFKVNNKSVSEIHNRYEQTEHGDWTNDKYNNPDTYAAELEWKDANKPSTKVVTEDADPTKINAEDRKGRDNRQWTGRYKILPVVKGKPITIEFVNPAITGVKGFYVTLDEKFAQESAPSELNAWNSYTYENVGYNGKPAKLFEGNKGTITIKDMNNVQGDVIGFRVYAVNYDGTLYDPDGRSFYVAVGDVKKEMTIEQKNVEIDMETAANTTPKFVSEKIPVDFSGYDFDASSYSWAVTEKDASKNKPTAFSVEYFEANGTKVYQLSKNVKAIRFVLTDPGQFIDGAVYNVSTTLKKNISSAATEVCTVNASFKKVMPTSAPTFGYRDGFDENTEYIRPDEGNYEVRSYNKGGTFDFRNTLIINNNVTTWNGMDLFTEGTYIFNVADGTYNNGALDKASCTGSSYILRINNGNNNLVDNSTKRKISAQFVYKRISKKYDTNSERYLSNQNWKADSPTTKDIIYSTWSKNFAVATNGGEKWAGNGKKATEAGYIEPANVVEWKTAAGTTTSLDLSKVTVKVDKLNLLPVTTGVTGTTLDKFFASNVIAVVSGQYGEVYTTGTGAAKDQINPYFSATIDPIAKTVTLKQSNQATIPSTANKGEIHFTVKDCFGNKKNITLPFVIKMPEVATTAKKH